MISVPNALWSYLTSNASRYVWAYELVLTDATVLRYSTEDITWGGNTYTGLVVEQTPLKESIDFIVPEVTVYFGNSGGALRTYLEPTDKLTGAKLTIRLLFRDSIGGLLSDSVVLFKGTVEPTTGISEETFPLTAIGILDGSGVEIPRRRLTTWCPWQFANADAFDGNGHCPYASTTTASGSGTGSTSLTLAGNADKFANGDTIIIGAAANAPVAIASGGGTVNLTLAAARTWVNGDAVRHSTCNREFSDCDKRQMTHRFGGFLGVTSLARAQYLLMREILARIPGISEIHLREYFANPPDWLKDLIADFSRNGSSADPTKVVPVLYGRRLVSPIAIEYVCKYVDSTNQRRATFTAISEGVIDSVVRYYVDNVLGTDRVTGTKKTFGIYWRDGNIGLDDSETEAEYDADPTTQKRNQNRDADTLTGSSYSETAHCKMVQAETLDNSFLPNLALEVKGRKLQKYTTAGATDGSPAWSENPIWQIVDLLTNDRYGIGLGISDIDFSVVKPEADYCDEVISSTEANTTVTASKAIASTDCDVASTEGFVPGRRVDVNGVSNTVDRITSDTRIILGTAVIQSIGQTVIQKPPRFGSSLWIDAPASSSTWIRRLLTACRGYITYDAGKVQIRVEREVVSEKLTDGAFEIWSSATNLTNWSEAAGGGTVNQETAPIHGGSYSVRLTRTSASGTLNVSQGSISGLTPGSIYRLSGWVRVGSGSVANVPWVEFKNTTQSLSYKGSTKEWLSGTQAVLSSGGTVGAWVKWESSIRIPPTFGTTDSYSIVLSHANSDLSNVYYDDVSLRGPFSADCREVGDVLNMGILADSFEWAPEGKERETNRVVMKIVNESGYLGPDEAVAQDFVHQRTHPVKTLNIDGSAVVDRDQATRICKWKLSKYRDLGRGSKFDAGPGAIAVQPGDAILVSHSVPNWETQEHRVVSKEIYGRGDDRELCVSITTEPIHPPSYSVVGPVARRIPSRPAFVLTATLRRRSARQVMISWARDASGYTLFRYQIHKSTTGSFTPDASNMCGVTRANRYVYQAEHDEILTTLYFKVVAVTDRGEVASNEVSGAIVNDTADDLDPTAMEAALPINMVYGSDFNDPAKWSTTGAGSTYPGTSRDPNADSDGGGALTWSDAGNARDSTNGTEASVNVYTGNSAIHYYDFAAATRTGRPRIEARKVVNSGSGTFTAHYTLDKNAGTVTWVSFASVTSSTEAKYNGPTLDSVDMSKFRIRLTASAGPLGNIDCYCDEVDFEESAGPSYYGEVSGGQAVIKGDGTNYGSVYRSFPMQTPGVTTGEIFNASRLGRAEIWLRKLNAGDSLDANKPVLFELYDSDLGTVWTMASISVGDIAGTTRAYELTWTPGTTPVKGDLKVRIRTQNSKPIAIKRCLVAAGDLIFKWIPSPEELAAGYLGDFSEGDIDGWPSGARVVGTYRYSEVS